MSEGGPWVIAALFCANVESRHGRFSIIDVSNEWTLTPGERPDYVFIVTVSGGDPGYVDVSIEVHEPGGFVASLDPQRMDLYGAHANTTWVLRGGLVEHHEVGTYWVNVIVNGEFACSSPIVFKRSPNL